MSSFETPVRIRFVIDCFKKWLKRDFLSKKISYEVNQKSNVQFQIVFPKEFKTKFRLVPSRQELFQREYVQNSFCIYVGGDQ